VEILQRIWTTCPDAEVSLSLSVLSLALETVLQITLTSATCVSSSHNLLGLDKMVLKTHSKSFVCVVSDFHPTVSLLFIPDLFPALPVL